MWWCLFILFLSYLFVFLILFICIKCFDISIRVYDTKNKLIHIKKKKKLIVKRTTTKTLYDLFKETWKTFHMKSNVADEGILIMLKDIMELQPSPLEFESIKLLCQAIIKTPEKRNECYPSNYLKSQLGTFLKNPEKYRVPEKRTFSNFKQMKLDKREGYEDVRMYTPDYSRYVYDAKDEIAMKSIIDYLNNIDPNKEFIYVDTENDMLIHGEDNVDALSFYCGANGFIIRFPNNANDENNEYEEFRNLLLTMQRYTLVMYGCSPGDLTFFPKANIIDIQMLWELVLEAKNAHFANGNDDDLPKVEGERRRIGLAKLAFLELKLMVDKTLTCSRWSRKKLTEAEIIYALADCSILENLFWTFTQTYGFSKDEFIGQTWMWNGNEATQTQGEKTDSPDTLESIKAKIKYRIENLKTMPEEDPKPKVEIKYDPKHYETDEWQGIPNADWEK